MYLVRAYSRNSGQRLILARKGIFMKKMHFLWKRAIYLKKEHFFWKKGTKYFTPPIQSLLWLFCIKIKLCILFAKGQRSIVKCNIECNIGLEYTLLVTSNAHISTTWSHPLWKNVNDWKSYVPTVPMIMSFKVFEVFF